MGCWNCSLSQAPIYAHVEKDENDMFLQMKVRDVKSNKSKVVQWDFRRANASTLEALEEVKGLVTGLYVDVTLVQTVNKIGQYLQILDLDSDGGSAVPQPHIEGDEEAANEEEDEVGSEAEEEDASASGSEYDGEEQLIVTSLGLQLDPQFAFCQMAKLIFYFATYLYCLSNL